MEHSENRQERGRFDLLVFFLALLLSIVLLSLSKNTSLAKPKEIGLSVASLFQMGLHETKEITQRGLTSVQEIKRIRALYLEALSELTSYQGLDRELNKLRNENEQLRQLLDFSMDLQHRNIPAEVIARDPENFFSSIVINKGTRDGIRHGDAVITHQKGMLGLVGRIVEVGLNTSIVLPITDSSSYVAARLQESRYEGLVNGGGEASPNISMDYISHKALADIEKEDLIVTSGMKSLYPEGIIIGRVISISSKEYSRTLQLEIDPSVDLSKLEYVMVIKIEE